MSRCRCAPWWGYEGSGQEHDLHVVYQHLGAGMSRSARQRTSASEDLETDADAQHRAGVHPGVVDQGDRVQVDQQGGADQLDHVVHRLVQRRQSTASSSTFSTCPFSRMASATATACSLITSCAVSRPTPAL